MTQQTITQIILQADNGYYLTNGETFGTTVILPCAEQKALWWEITAEEKAQLEKELLEAAKNPTE